MGGFQSASARLAGELEYSSNFTGWEGSASFLQKRSKKRLSMGARTVVRAPTGKGFLLLFFKKEALLFHLKA
jgi:hypothetical protein